MHHDAGCQAEAVLRLRVDGLGGGPQSDHVTITEIAPGPRKVLLSTTGSLRDVRGYECIFFISDITFLFLFAHFSRLDV